VAPLGTELKQTRICRERKFGGIKSTQETTRRKLIECNKLTREKTSAELNQRKKEFGGNKSTATSTHEKKQGLAGVWHYAANTHPCCAPQLPIKKQQINA